MNKRWITLGAFATALAVVALLGVGASAFAQGPAPQGTLPALGQGYGMGMGVGRMGGNGAGPQSSLVAVAAKVLGMNQTDLVSALNGGKPIGELAKEKGVATDKIVDEFLAPRVATLKSMVDAKRLTQAQADAWLNTMKTNITAQLSEKFTPHGPGMGVGFVDANNDGICDHCGADHPAGQPLGGAFGMRGRWNR